MKKLDFKNLLEYLNKGIEHAENCISYCKDTSVPEETMNVYINERNAYKFLHMLVTMSVGNITGYICNDDACKMFAIDGVDSDAYLINMSDISYFVSKEEYEMFKPFMKNEKDERK